MQFVKRFVIPGVCTTAIAIAIIALAADPGTAADVQGGADDLQKLQGTWH
jgi:hypothetical protein